MVLTGKIPLFWMSSFVFSNVNLMTSKKQNAGLILSPCVGTSCACPGVKYNVWFSLHLCSFSQQESLRWLFADFAGGRAPLPVRTVCCMTNTEASKIANYN